MKLKLLCLVCLMTACTKARPFTVEQYATRLQKVSSTTADQHACHPRLEADGSVSQNWCIDGHGAVTNVASTTPRAAPARAADLSILLWSCNEPFAFEVNAQEPSVSADAALSLHTMALRSTGRLSIPDFPATPTFAIAMGDQVYVDPEAGDLGADGATLAAFTGDKSDELNLVGMNDATVRSRFYETLYRASFLNPAMNEVLKTPTIMSWDDHELRDGWGSQGDERGATSSGGAWADWYQSASEAYAKWQLRRGPAAAEYPCGEHVARPRTLSVAGVNTFVFDVRSCRGLEAASPVLGARQREAFAAWAGQTSCDRNLVVVTGTPLTVASGPTSAMVGAAVKELRDDRHDAWATEGNRVDRDFIFAQLAARGPRCPDERLLLISGDIHTSLLSKFELGGKTGFEIVSSGVAAGVRGGSENVAWANVKPIAHPLLTSELLGRTGAGPSWAELLIKANGDVSVAWFAFSSDRPQHLALSRPFETLACGQQTDQTVSTRNRNDVSSGFDVLVDQLWPEDKRSTMQSGENLAPKISSSPVKSAARLQNIDSRTLCEELNHEQ